MWLRQGIKARRTRNEGRVRALEAMRAERAARREQIGNVRLQVEQAEQSGKLVFEAQRDLEGRTTASAGGRRISRPASCAAIASASSARTAPARRRCCGCCSGSWRRTPARSRHGANVQIAYYDQQREQLDPERTVFDTIGEGNDTVTANGRTRHVHAYLRDFLFSDERARSPVKALSGGERNRLLLARLFTRPANVLVLDEPTNDLDLETLELLEEQLVEWPGTLLLVSHDRVFLDNVVTSTLVFEGGGRVEEYVGGYAGLAAAGAQGRALKRLHRGRKGDRGHKGHEGAPRSARWPLCRASASCSRAARQRKRLSYKEQRELEALPARIEALESSSARSSETIAGPDFYKEAADAIKASLARADELQRELTAAYARWDALESRRQRAEARDAELDCD